MNVVPRRASIAALWLVPAAALWFASHRPCLELGFVGDDFQWWQHARMALEQPGLLLAPHGGYRPLNTWTMSLDHLLYGTWPWGYHLTSLLWHLGCGLVFWAFLGRLGLSAAARGVALALWLCSPYTLEPAQVVSERYEPALLASWLGLAMLWPRRGESWRRGRAVAAFLLGGLTAMCKESWVVLPAFTLLLDLTVARVGVVASLRRSALVALGPLMYMAWYFAHPPIAPGTYFGSALTGAIKIPHAWAVFSGLAPLRPMEFTFGVPEIAAVALASALAWLAWRWRSTAMAVGFGFFVLPFVPVLAVGWMTSRYTFMPLAGFLTVGVAAAEHAVQHVRARYRWPAAAGFVGLGLVVLATGLADLRGDMADARAFSRVHERLVAEAEAFAPRFPGSDAVVAVRLDSSSPLHEIARAPQGVAKVFFVRGADPAGLADWSALLSYVLDPCGGPLLTTVEPAAAAGLPFAVVGYAEGGFLELPRRAATVDGEVAAWRASGYSPRVLVPWKPR
jgi:hypothetical protein